MREAISSVCSTVVPSGARTATANCDSSFFGRKSLPASMKSGTVAANDTSAATTITQRCAIDHCSSRP